MAKNNKNLLSESQVRKFMKLANLTPLTPGFVSGLTEAEGAGETDEQKRERRKERLEIAREKRIESGGQEKEDEYQAAMEKKVKGSGLLALLQGPEHEAAMADVAAAADRPVEIGSTELKPDRDPDPITRGHDPESVKAREEKAAEYRAQAGRDTEAEMRATMDASTARHEKHRKENPEKYRVKKRPTELPPKKVDESHGRSPKEGARGRDKEDQNSRGVNEELDLGEDELEVDFGEVPEEEGLEDLEALEDVELEDEPLPTVSIDDFLSALELALESVLGDEVEVTQDEEIEDEDLEEFPDEDLDLDLEGDEEEDLALQEKRRRQPRGPKRKRTTQKRGKKLAESANLDALVNRITMKVAKKIVQEAFVKK